MKRKSYTVVVTGFGVCAVSFLLVISYAFAFGFKFGGEKGAKEVCSAWNSD